MATPTFEEFASDNADHPDARNPLKMREAYAHLYPPPGWGAQALSGINRGLAAARNFVQPLANELVNPMEHVLGQGSVMGLMPFGSTPNTAVGRAVAGVLNPVPEGGQSLGGLVGNVLANRFVPGAKLGRMVGRPLATAGGAALGGLTQDEGIDPVGLGLQTGLAAAFEIPGAVSRARAAINQRPQNNADAAAYLSRSSGVPVPPTGPGVAAATEVTGPASIEQSVMAAYRKKFEDAIALVPDRPVLVTTSRPGEAQAQDYMPLAQAWDRMSTLPEWFQKRNMMEEIVTSLRAPWGATPPGPAAAAADLIESANAPLGRAMSAVNLYRHPDSFTPRGDVNVMANQLELRNQAIRAGRAYIPEANKADAVELIRRRVPGTAIDQPGVVPGLESTRIATGTRGGEMFLSPYRALQLRWPQLLGGPPPPGVSSRAPIAFPATYGLGSMPAPEGEVSGALTGEQQAALSQAIAEYERRRQQGQQP